MNNKSYNQNVSENEKRRIRARSKKFMIKEIDGLQHLYTKDAKAVVTENKLMRCYLYNNVVLAMTMPI
jgi:hypothetical protein